jgi:hypothetical protein
MGVIYGANQIRVTNLLSDGSPDGSAVAVTNDDIQSIDIGAVYIDGNEATLRGGDAIKAIVKEDSTFVGFNLTLKVATIDYALRKAIVGGTGDSDNWSAPKSDSEMPNPFKLELWCKNYTESDSESTQNGFVKYTFNFCKGKLGSHTAADQSFAGDEFTIEARRNDSNPTSIGPAVEMEEVSSIV